MVTLGDSFRARPIGSGIPGWLRPWHLTLAVLVMYLIGVLQSAGWDPMALARIGTRFDPGLPGGTMGYDGQFSYQIAVSPAESVLKLDVPAYRLQRILYPILARVVALGNEKAIPWSLLLVNMAAAVAGVALTERIMRLNRQSRWWAVAYGMNVGMFMSIRLDLTEPLAFVLVQAGVLAWALHRPKLSAAAFAAAALTKEVTVIILIGYLLVRFLRRGIREGCLWGAIALGPFLLWQAILWAWVGRVGLGSGGALSTPFEFLPFRGLWGVAIYDFRGFLTLSLLIVPLVIFPAVAGLLIAAKSLVSGATASAVALLLQAGIYLFLPMSNLVDPLAASRFGIGLICATLDFGARAGWRRVLAYSQLWILTLVFLSGDRLLPSG